MQQGEIIVARLRGGPTIGRCLDPPVPSSKGGARSVRVSMGRNREARLPVERVALATGVAAERDEEVEELRRQSEGLSADIDLSEVWGVVREEASALTLDEIAELHWESVADTARRIALCLYLEREQVFFASEGSTYSPRSAGEVEELLSRRRRREENRAASAALVDALSRGELPTDPSDHQKTLLNHLREYAVHGDSYTRSAVAQGILAQVQGETRDLQRLAFELLVDTGALSADEPLELERAGVPREFPRDAVEAAADLSAETAVREALRTDLTGVEAFTVDDEETRDRDDALSLEVLEPTGSGEAVYRLGVHITDAGALIPAGGALDREADRRMATLYLPDRKIPMLPPEVSSGKGSLTPGETRPAMSLMMRVTASGEVLDHEVLRSVVRSRAALSYREADRELGDPESPWHRVLVPLESIAKTLRRRREEAGAVEMEQPEMVIRVRDSGAVEVTVGSRSAPARSTVAELMVLCNSLLGEYCAREKLPAAYRSQPAPEVSHPPAADLPDAALRYVVMRRLRRAEVSTVARAHSGLGLPVYVHATSPLRRYPDLILQRQIGHFLSTGEPLYSTEEVASVAQRAEVQLPELSRIEEQRRRYWFLRFLKHRLEGNRDADDEALFDAVVLDNPARRPALLELADYPFRFRAELPASFVLGGTVTLKLHGVDLWRRTGQFVHVREEA